MRRFLVHFGQYVLLMQQLVVRRERWRVYYTETLKQVEMVGIGSLPIVLISGTFIGAVMTLNTIYQLGEDSLFADTFIGSVVSAAGLMEFAPTVTSLLLAGRVGSNMATEIGTMRVYEQIDAMEVMGVNAPSFLILPKLLGSLIAFPCLVVLAAFLIHVGGIAAGEYTNAINEALFMGGVRSYFDDFQVTFMMIKSVTYGFLVSTISSFQGWYVRGGPTEVGKASTRAVVISSILILLADFVLAQLLL